MSVAMQTFRLSFLFLPVDLYLVGESLWQMLHILDNWAVLGLHRELLLSVHSCRIETVSLVNSNGFTVPKIVLFLVQASPLTL